MLRFDPLPGHGSSGVISSAQVTSVLPIVLIPLSFLVFVRAREPMSVQMRTIQADAMFDVAEAAHNAITNYRMIADYYQRPAEVDRFLKRVTAFSQKLEQFPLKLNPNGTLKKTPFGFLTSLKDAILSTESRLMRKVSRLVAPTKEEPMSPLKQNQK